MERTVRKVTTNSIHREDQGFKVFSKIHEET
jgi:hypothetical protein